MFQALLSISAQILSLFIICNLQLQTLHFCLKPFHWFKDHPIEPRTAYRIFNPFCTLPNWFNWNSSSWSWVWLGLKLGLKETIVSACSKCQRDFSQRATQDSGLGHCCRLSCGVRLIRVTLYYQPSCAGTDWAGVRGSLIWPLIIVIACDCVLQQTHTAANSSGGWERAIIPWDVSV